jgi:plasmid stabilization system protein ParE
MQVCWTVNANLDLLHISRHIRQENPTAAHTVVKTIYDSIMALEHLPYRAPIGRSDGTRELICLPYPYTAVCRVTHKAIDVLHIYHHAQDWT